MAKKNALTRKEGALERFEKQLLAGTKPEKVNGRTTEKMIPLTEIDKSRVQKQVDVLKERIKKAIV